MTMGVATAAAQETPTTVRDGSQPAIAMASRETRNSAASNSPNAWLSSTATRTPDVSASEGTHAGRHAQSANSAAAPPSSAAAPTSGSGSVATA